MNRFILCSIILLAIAGCTGSNTPGYHAPPNPLFTQMPSSETGIRFINRVIDDSVMNIFSYRNFYNGAGVAIGDINNDGLPDIFFSCNKEQNKLYLNKGNFKFEDITQSSGVNAFKFWSTGVTMVDINGDGLLDIYVCNAGDSKGKERVNQLYINNGNLTFSEKAAGYKLQDRGGYHTHAAFFDYDSDGDLDCYLLNNSSFPVAQVRNWDQRLIRDSTGGHKLLKNNKGIFEDVSGDAGIYGSLIGFGLGVTIGDVNGDMWPDLYISNDFFEKDYLYINQQNGKFKEVIDESMQHTSQSSMGADMADINNDGLQDIFSTDMLPEDDYRLKTMTKFEDYDFFNTKLRGNLHRQFLQNCLQLNNGDNTFSEIGQLAGVNATDWSWGALIFDFDNDGWKDIFVSNGMNKDITNQDYIDFLGNENIRNEVAKKGHFDLEKFLAKMQSTPLPNYGFVNEKGSMLFANQSYDLGLAMPSFSNGAAYADLDNDGDLDLVVSNVNMESFVYRNNAEKLTTNNYIKLKLEGLSPNTFGIGARVTAFVKSEKIMLQQNLSRGFQSSVDPSMCIGIGNNKQIDSLEIIWPDFKKQVLYNIVVNTMVKLKQGEALQRFTSAAPALTPAFLNVTSTIITGDITHKEDAYVDFDKEWLIPKMLSTEGPKIATGDLNGDGLEDFCVGGATGDPAKLFFQTKEGKFAPALQLAFEQDKDYEDIGIEFCDIDNDKDLDIVIASGGNTDFAGSTRLVPRIYINEGKGTFYRGLQNMPYVSTNASCLRMHDYNGDGYADMMIGGRNTPKQYGVLPASYLLQNDGTGKFIDVTDKVAPELKNAGMLTDAQWADMDGDGKHELIVTGDWMPILIFKYMDGKLKKQSEIKNSDGWWNCVQIADMNNDGRMDILAGNWGLNSKLKADTLHPAKLYVNDFDKNGQVECVPTYYKSDGVAYPYFLRGDISIQMPFLKKKFLRYDEYAGKSIAQIFSADQLKTASVLKVDLTETGLFINQGNLNFSFQALPVQAQLTNVFSILVQDINADGINDIFLAGNFSGLKPELGRMDASYGVTLLGSKTGRFKYSPPSATGLFIKGEVRDVKTLQLANKRRAIIMARNNEALQMFTMQKPGLQ
ncbi:MAG: VCBS repeat-containing protein [Ferruginibacter sp.]|nr:VCBS repeat-containing protein [Ferruginibacter sp.]